ncbi:hypothetical protein [Ectobacillus polymachus]|uniref:SMODS-associated NUDIX domain-containing protein n=1 Tax=Ectobacillus polymachus TaxID=1508806 RepID=UPI003A8B694F
MNLEPLVYFIIIILISLLVNIFNFSNDMLSLLFGLLACAIYGIIKIFIDGTTNIREAWWAVQSQTFYREKKLRLSISYLFRIKVNNKYLLIKGNRINQFQPVGGVYKYYDRAFIEGLEFSEDSFIKADDVSKNDLRIFIKGKYLIKFMNWFKKGVSRECSANREFFEELIESGILPEDKFKILNYKYIGRKTKGIYLDDYFKCHQILIADIFEFIPSNDQLKALKELLNNETEKYIWADEELILQRGVIKGKDRNNNISLTAEWIIE